MNHQYGNDKLDYLIILAEERNITRAAARLYISQPALTAYINRLEDELGVKLFDRSASPIKITAAGTCYIAEMEKLRSQHHKLYNDLRRLQYDPEQMLTVGIGRNRGSIWLPRILPGIYERFPDAHLTIIEDRDERLSEKVHRNMLDLCVIESHVQHGRLAHRFLAEEAHALITSYDNPHFSSMDRAGNGPHHLLDINPTPLGDQVFICSSLSGGLTPYTQQLFSLYSINPREILYIANSATSYQLAVKGLGVTYMSVSQAEIMHATGRPLYMMPGGKPAIRRLYTLYDDTRSTELKRFFIEHTEAVMRQFAAGNEETGLV